MRRLVPALVLVLLAAGSHALQARLAAPQAAGADGWRTFEGALSASGDRQVIPTESGRPAVTIQLSGPVSIAAGAGLSRGFRGEIIGFDEGTGVIVLRAVWTDGHGDRIFSRLKGDTVAAGRRVEGVFTGGTGRYAGITGDFSFEWQYVVEAEAGTISGRGVGLRGRFRAAGARK